MIFNKLFTKFLSYKHLLCHIVISVNQLLVWAGLLLNVWAEEWWPAKNIFRWHIAWKLKI